MRSWSVASLFLPARISPRYFAKLASTTRASSALRLFIRELANLGEVAGGAIVQRRDFLHALRPKSEQIGQRFFEPGGGAAAADILPEFGIGANSLVVEVNADGDGGGKQQAAGRRRDDQKPRRIMMKSHADQCYFLKPFRIVPMGSSMCRSWSINDWNPK